MTTNPAGSTEPAATSPATETAVTTRPCAGDLPAVCVDVIDHGTRETPWGMKPQVSLVFECNLNGSPKFLTRTYNNYAFSKSALALEIKNWLGLDISSNDEDFELDECVGRQATLRTSDTVSKTGNHYQKIESVNPGGRVEVQLSGTYERKEMNW